MHIDFADRAIGTVDGRLRDFGDVPTRRDMLLIYLRGRTDGDVRGQGHYSR